MYPFDPMVKLLKPPWLLSFFSSLLDKLAATVHSHLWALDPCTCTNAPRSLGFKMLKFWSLATGEVMEPLQLKFVFGTPVNICWTGYLLDRLFVDSSFIQNTSIILHSAPRASKLCRSPRLQWWGEQCNDLGPSQNQCKPHTCQAGLEQK